MKRGTDDTLVAAGEGLQGEDAVPANTTAAENESSSLRVSP